MRVIISDAVVTSAVGTPNVLKLHELIGFARQQKRHYLFFESDVGFRLILDTFSQEVRPLYKNLLEQSVRDALGFPSGRATIKIDEIQNSLWAVPVPTLTLDDALKVLAEKLVILVENSTNDWNFLRGIMTPMDRKLIQNYVDLGWAQAVHGGGDTLGKILAERLRTPWQALRTFVLFDSDRLHPAEFDANWTTERPGSRPAACLAYGWENTTRIALPNRYWMLKRRFIESYMPRSELSIGAEKKSHEGSVDAFFAMPRDSRWYYNMKEGFAGDARRTDQDRCGDLFNVVSDEQRAALDGGFGNTLARHYAASIDREFDWDVEARAEADVALPPLLQLL